MNRTNLILSGLLIVQLLGFGLGYVVCSDAPASRMRPVPILPGLDVSRVQALTIHSAKDKHIRLVRSGAGWQLPEQANYPADQAKVEKLIGRLGGLQATYVVARTPDRHVKLEVADDRFRRKVILATEQGEQVLLVGSSGQSGYTHVRVQGRPEVYAVDDLNEWQLGIESRDWIQAEYLRAPAERLIGLVLKRGNGELRLTRSSRDGWRIGEKPVPAERVRPLVDKAVAIDASDVVGRLDDPAVQQRLARAVNRVDLELELAAEPVPESAAPAADGGLPDGEQPAPVVPVSERRVVHLAEEAGHKSDLLVWEDQASHAVRVDRWRLDALLQASADKLTKEAAASAGH